MEWKSSKLGRLNAERMCWMVGQDHAGKDILQDMNLNMKNVV